MYCIERGISRLNGGRIRSKRDRSLPLVWGILIISMICLFYRVALLHPL